ncbi:hypothetical protein DH2020_021237 [Rehmannia glutinosa]|uniref:Myb/SANT-like domain-containing protein n=1 Tax=Rehmannia glutinosa TaxID=99300 RepID=A0ABR0WDQ0_REHGL
MGETAKNSERNLEPVSWPDSVERILIELMMDEIGSFRNFSTTLTKKSWKRIGDKLCEKAGRNYSYSQLRHKFNELKIRYQAFCELLEESGLNWDPLRCSLKAADAASKSCRKENKNTKKFQGKGKGCPMFPELGIIFLENPQVYFQTANCSMDAERADEEYGSRNVSPSASPHITSNCKDNPSVDARTTAKGPIERTEIAVPSMPLASNKKRKDSTDMSVGPLKNVKGNPDSDGFSITKCVKCLDSIEGLDSNTYLKAIKMFKDADWREMFMAMSTRRRLDWLASLK